MECSFRVGQKVVALKGDWFGVEDNLPCSGPIAGGVYTISDFDTSSADVYLVLKEMGNDDAYRPRWFRPVVERGTEKGMSILRDLLNKQSQPERVDA